MNFLGRGRYNTADVSGSNQYDKPISHCTVNCILAYHVAKWQFVGIAFALSKDIVLLILHKVVIDVTFKLLQIYHTLIEISDVATQVFIRFGAARLLRSGHQTLIFHSEI